MINLHIKLAVLISAVAASGVHAEGYLRDASEDDVVTNAYGECWHTRAWDPEDAIIGCDGKVAEVVEAEPEPEPAPAPKPRKVLKHVTLDAVTFFEFDKAELRPKGETRLDHVIEGLQDYERISTIRITGHADPIGDRRYNARLSAERAAEVKRYLVEHGGLDPSVLLVQSKGETEPVVTCDDKRGQALIQCLQPNRRVEIDIEATSLVTTSP